jgi:hypothetical protein
MKNGGVPGLSAENAAVFLFGKKFYFRALSRASR